MNSLKKTAKYEEKLLTPKRRVGSSVLQTHFSESVDRGHFPEFLQFYKLDRSENLQYSSNSPCTPTDKILSTFLKQYDFYEHFKCVDCGCRPLVTIDNWHFHATSHDHYGRNVLLIPSLL